MEMGVNRLGTSPRIAPQKVTTLNVLALSDLKPEFLLFPTHFV
jgi:hypothetical protein